LNDHPDRYWGFFLVLFIIGASPGGGGGGGGALVGNFPLIAFFSSSGLGMPGVGVAPGLIPFFNSSGLGMPGVGVAPFGTAVFAAGMPGVVFADGWTGTVEMPAGIFAGSTLTGPVPTLAAVLFELLFTGAPPQAYGKCCRRDNDAANDLYHNFVTSFILDQRYK
jgi:hypothetical protein